LIGLAAHLLLGMPDWVTAAIMFNNTTSYPLLLIESLNETGILSGLIVTNETTRDAIERAKSYFLVFATVSSCLTFAVGPRLIDTEHAPDDEDLVKSDEGDEGYHDEDQPDEQTGLLGSRSHRPSVAFFPSKLKDLTRGKVYDRRPSLISQRRWLDYHPRTQWWLLFLYDFLNAPLIGALIGAIIGLVPVLHRAFFSDTQDGGIFTAWFTSSLQTIGRLFVPLPVVIAGVSLYTSYQDTKNEEPTEENSTPWSTTVFILVIRFIVWPAASIGFIYALAKNTDILGTDPMLWFTMALMPTGPSAMKLITMVQVSYASDQEEHKIAKLLTISYIISPILSFTVMGSLHAAKAAIGT